MTWAVSWPHRVHAIGASSVPQRFLRYFDNWFFDPSIAPKWIWGPKTAQKWASYLRPDGWYRKTNLWLYGAFPWISVVFLKPENGRKPADSETFSTVLGCKLTISWARWGVVGKAKCHWIGRFKGFNLGCRTFCLILLRFGKTFGGSQFFWAQKCPQNGPKNVCQAKRRVTGISIYRHRGRS